MASHEVHHDYRPDSISDGVKAESAEYIEAPAVAVGDRGPPPHVKSLSPEERIKAERKLVRKIDIRLIPTIILM